MNPKIVARAHAASQVDAIVANIDTIATRQANAQSLPYYKKVRIWNRISRMEQVATCVAKRLASDLA